jgi:hypothetical protein
MDRTPRFRFGLIAALLLAALPAPPAAPGQAAVAAPQTCLNEVPEAIAEALMHRVIGQLGLATQARLLAEVARREDLGQDQRELIARYAAISGASPPPLAPLPHAEPAPASLPALGLTLTDYRWHAARGRLDAAEPCSELTLRDPAECSPGASDIHNLVVGFLRTRHGLCEGPVAWQPSPDAHPLVAEVAAILADPAYYGALERWLENDRDWSFRRPGDFFTLLYMDYLALSYEHGQINFALSELLGRRGDLRSAYPALDTLRRQLALLKELNLIE